MCMNRIAQVKLEAYAAIELGPTPSESNWAIEDWYTAALLKDMAQEILELRLQLKILESKMHHG